MGSDVRCHEGAALGSAPLEEDAACCMFGDFYHEQDDVSRGVTLGNLAPLSLSVYEDECTWAGGVHAISTGSDVPQGKEMSQGSSSLLPARFHVTEVGRELLPEYAEHLAVSTAFLRNTSCSDAANRVLDFFEGEDCMQVTKVSRIKFSIKVTAFISGVTCELKVFIFKHAEDGAAVEFQRRRGDCLAFEEVYRRASQFVTRRTGKCLDIPKADAYAQLGNTVSQFPSEQLLLPLLEMACVAQHPDVQAQAAMGLWWLQAQDESAMTDQLCSQEVVAALQTLLSVPRLDVSYPTACLLAFLAQRQEVEKFFFDLGLPELMREKLQASDMDKIAKVQVALAMRGIKCCEGEKATAFD